MIQLHQVTKRFGEKLAVNDVSFTVQKGQVLGLLGANGAGKSTTMKMITGCLRPTSGSILLGDYDVWKSPIKAKQQLGFLPESAPSYDDLTVEEFLAYMLAIRGISGKAKQNAIDKVIDLCYLSNVRKQSADTLSKGYRHRICLAQSIVHDPNILILDEPTDGLDPNQKREIRNLLNIIKQDKTIILSTHILDEVDAVCSDVVLMDKGQIIREGTPTQLRSESPTAKRLKLTITQPWNNTLQSRFETIPRVLSITTQGDNILFETDATTEEDKRSVATTIHDACVESKLCVESLAFQAGSLEEVFRDLTFKQTA